MAGKRFSNCDDRNRTRSASAALAMTVALAVSACATSIEGSPVSDPSTSPKLDTGNFPTTPAVIGDAATAQDAWLQESWRIADGVPAPWSIDPALSAPAEGFVGLGLVSPVQLQSVENTQGIAIFTLGQMQTMYSIPFLGGFVTAGADAIRVSKVSVGALRYTDPAAARRAAEVLSENVPALPTEFPAIDDTRPLGVDRGPNARVAATVPHGDLLLIAAGSGSTLERASDLAGRALKAQLAKIKDYAPTLYLGFPPLKVPMDRDGIMSRLLPHTGKPPEPYAQLGLSPSSTPFDGYRSIDAHRIANVDKREFNERLSTTFGVDLVAVSEVPVFAVLYRTRESAAATLLIRDRVPDGRVTTTVPGLSQDSARCAVEEKTERMTRCWIAWGRYAVSLGSTDPKLAKQAAAAQYSILKAAG